MSSLFKGVRKVFKKIGKFVKKILPVVLAVGALVFTGGAALGLTGGLTWGGASGIAASIGSAIGGQGLIGSVLTGAIRQAGYGALIGGTVSAASGGSFSKGAKAGAKAGAITGAVMGGYGHLKNSALKNAQQTAGIGDEVAAQPPPGTEIQAAGTQASGVTTYGLGQKVGNITPGTGHMSIGGGAGAGAGSGAGGLFTQGGWLERNQDLVGNVVKGVGAGLVAGGEADAEKDLLRERQRIINENYAGADPGKEYRAAEPNRYGLMPTERFTGGYYGSYEYRYNPETARIERVPTGG